MDVFSCLSVEGKTGSHYKFRPFLVEPYTTFGGGLSSKKELYNVVTAALWSADICRVVKQCSTVQRFAVKNSAEQSNDQSDPARSETNSSSRII